MSQIVQTKQTKVSSSGGGLSEQDHKDFNHLVHDIAENSYDEIIFDGENNLTNFITWETSDKLKRIREIIIAYDVSGNPTSHTTNQYSNDGTTIVETLTKNPINWSNGFPTNIEKVLS